MCLTDFPEDLISKSPHFPTEEDLEGMMLGIVKIHADHDFDLNEVLQLKLREYPINKLKYGL